MGQAPSKPLTEAEWHAIQAASWANGAWELNEAPDGITETGLGVDASLAVTWEARFGDAPKHNFSKAYSGVMDVEWIESRAKTARSALALAYDRALVKKKMNLSAEALTVTSLASTLMAEAGYAQNTIDASDDDNLRKVAAANDIALDKLPNAAARAEHFVGAAAIPPNIVSRTMVLISRASTFAFVRVHALGTFARPAGISPEPGTRNGILERVAKVIGLDPSNGEDRNKLYWFMKSVHWVAHAAAQSSAFPLNGSAFFLILGQQDLLHWLLYQHNGKNAMCSRSRERSGDRYWTVSWRYTVDGQVNGLALNGIAPCSSFTISADTAGQAIYCTIIPGDFEMSQWCAPHRAQR